MEVRPSVQACRTGLRWWGNGEIMLVWVGRRLRRRRQSDQACRFRHRFTRRLWKFGRGDTPPVPMRRRQRSRPDREQNWKRWQRHHRRVLRDAHCDPRGWQRRRHLLQHRNKQRNDRNVPEGYETLETNLIKLEIAFNPVLHLVLMPW